MISANVVGSGKGVEDENGIGSILVESAPGGIGKLGRWNASAVAEGEISEREECAFCVGHGGRKTEMKDF